MSDSTVIQMVMSVSKPKRSILVLRFIATSPPPFCSFDSFDQRHLLPVTLSEIDVSMTFFLLKFIHVLIKKHQAGALLLPLRKSLENSNKKRLQNYPWLSPHLTSQILRDGVFEGLPPDAQFVRSEAR